MKARLIWVLIAAAAVAAPALGQETVSTVSGTGVEEAKVLPDELRVNVSLVAKGETLADALAAYHERADELTEIVVKAGAKEDSVEIGDPSIGEGGSAEQQRRQMMMQRMIEPPAGFGEEEEEDTRRSVSFTLKATWVLSGAGIEELLVEADEIKAAIEGIDFVNKAAMTPAELEELEEMAMSAQEMYYDESAPRPGEPTIFYAGKIADEKVAEMRRAAYAKAARDAEEKAALAGGKPGAIRGIQVWDSASTPDMYSDYRSQMMYRNIMRYGGAGPLGEEGVAVSTELARIPLKVRVVVSYELE